MVVVITSTFACGGRAIADAGAGDATGSGGDPSTIGDGTTTTDSGSSESSGEPSRCDQPPIELPELVSPNVYAMAPTPDGGAVAVGHDRGYALVVRVDADGQIVWTSTCSSDGIGAVPHLVAVIDDRIVIAGSRSAERDCVDPCPGASVVWMQQLTLDGTVVATDDPGSLFGATHPREYAAVVGGGPAQGITMLVNGPEGDEAALMRFPW